MPEYPDSKPKEHPWKFADYADGGGAPTLWLPNTARLFRYAELKVTSNFTFLSGASHPDELVRRAAKLELAAIAITDTNTLAGIVWAHVAAKKAGIPLVVGCRLVFTEPVGLSVLAYATDRASYGRLCKLLTLGKRRASKGQCHLRVHDLIEYHNGLLATVVPPARLDQDFIDVVRGLKEMFDTTSGGGDRLSIAASYRYSQDDAGRVNQIAAMCQYVGVPMVATNDVHYHAPSRRPLQDVLTCIRHRCTIEQAGFLLHPNAERYLKPPEEMARLFARYPHAIERTVDLAQRACSFNLDELRYEYPDEPCPPGTTPMQHLAELATAGSKERYPAGVPEKVRQQIRYELNLIEELGYAPYFLTVHDIVVFARSRDILCQGRGTAANSAVCYCLGITAVDPDHIDVLFERFVSKERDEPPDIDIDFEHERREEVIQYLYRKYGRHRAALTAVVTSYRKRSAVRDVGKALGFSADDVTRLSKSLDWWDHHIKSRNFRDLGLNPHDPTARHLIRLSGQLRGFPRHLSQHVGGFVITRGPLCELVPIENAAMEDRTVIEWDKDDIDAMGMLKVDVLGLGMLTCIRKGFELIRQHHGRDLSLATVPPEDPCVYDMICRADTVGVFQIESRAQMSMLPRLKPRCYYDLVIEVAIVRPGPIQGQMVHPYLRRRNGQEPVTYPDQNVEGVLKKTLGVPLFQEQVMSLAVIAAGFTPGEADQLRRAIAAWKSRGQNHIMGFEMRFIGGMVERGYDRGFAQRCFEQIKGFGDYGFPESHAASFALLVYVSSWIKRHYPAAFACALLNSQPMGFYAPAQIIRDAKDHGVKVLPVDLNASRWDSTLEESGKALRLGMRQVRGLREDDAETVIDAVQRYGPFRSVQALFRATTVPVRALRRLASADAFGSMGLDRQAALWEVRTLRDLEMPLFDQGETRCDSTESLDEPTTLPRISEPRKTIQDYRAIGLSLKAHPVSFIRETLSRRDVIPAQQLRDEKLSPSGKTIAVAGIVLVRQRPGTASGIVFMTLEDETGVANLIVRPEVYQRHKRAARGNIIVARGRIERQGQVVHLLAQTLKNVSHELYGLCTTSRDFR